MEKNVNYIMVLGSVSLLIPSALSLLFNITILNDIGLYLGGIAALIYMSCLIYALIKYIKYNNKTISDKKKFDNIGMFYVSCVFIYFITVIF